VLGSFVRFVESLRDDDGAALVEWGLLVVLIAVVALVAVSAGGLTVSETYSEISSNLVNASS
jgi:Flp pilus assembly pilin Flp